MKITVMLSRSGNQVIKILQLGNYFPYLPLYDAKSQNFFDLLPEGINVEIETVNHRNRNDQGICRELSQKPLGDKIWFAVADPCEVSRTDNREQLIVLAPIVTNSSFWIIAKNRERIERLTDLKNFSKINAYSQGTTSYGIATKIRAQLNRQNSNRRLDLGSVEPLNELSDTYYAALPSNEVILSPDLLGICRIKQLHPDTSQWMIGNSPEFKDILVTALITRKDVLNDVKGREVAQALVQSLQRSFLRISDSTYETVMLDTIRNYCGDRLETYSDTIRDSIFRSALEEARKTRIFPIFVKTAVGTWVSTYMMSRYSVHNRETYEVSDETYLDWENQAYTQYNLIDPQNFSVVALEKELFLPIREYHETSTIVSPNNANIGNYAPQNRMKDFLETLPRWIVIPFFISAGLGFGAMLAWLNFGNGQAPKPEKSNDLKITFPIQWTDKAPVDKVKIELKINGNNQAYSANAENGSVTFLNMPRKGDAKISLFCRNEPSARDQNSKITWNEPKEPMYEYKPEIVFNVNKSDCIAKEKPN